MPNVRTVPSRQRALLGPTFFVCWGGINGVDHTCVRGAPTGFQMSHWGCFGWALGYVSGCIMTSPLVARVGHIQTLAAMAAIAAVSILTSAIVILPWAWLPAGLRVLFCRGR
jgi:hypothetical protein